MANHFGFLDSQEEELNRIGLEIYDVSPGRYLEIDLNIDRKEPQRVYPYGRFDTITVLNPQEIIDHETWIYINRPYLENRYPLNQISRMETKGNEIYLQHEKINAKLKLLVGGDARAFKVDPINKDNSVTDLGLLNDKAKNIQDYTEILKDNSEINTTNIGQINVKQNEVIQNLEDIKENLEWLYGALTELEQARELLEAISGKDFATQTTLAQVKSELELVKAELQAIKANQLSGDQKVQLSGTIATRETLLNAVSVPAGGNTGFVQIPTLGCKKIILMVNSDKTWRLLTNRPASNAVSGEANHMYPDVYTEAQNPMASSNYPRDIIVGYGAGEAQSMLDALDKALPWQDVRIRVENVSSDVATFTVRVLRIWEV